ncbi:hypothetical protein F2Q69_00059608 [Brassica cretica]|uniref:Uncharacterized protein n=1 Tax=Brassica cretica TaxID=69181 RepID=A0A8S9RKB5_BRACR|nr:hypothetical protein F2Q69_00059608 [Brassica cretica]
MFLSKRLERNGSRNQTSSLTQSFGPFGIFELAFQCHRSEVNQHPVAEVMSVLLKGGQSTPSSSADGRAGSTTRPARPAAELNQSSSADGRA